MLLVSERYNEIEREVVDLFSRLSIKKFPLDCVEICKQLGIDLFPYSGLSEKKRKATNVASRDCLSLLKKRSGGQYTDSIFYNDRMPDSRVRFTIMHEIGHIVLEHAKHGDLVESEANYFAKFALAPPPLIRWLKIENYQELADRFGVSRECAYFSMRKYFKWLERGRFKLSDHENALISQFRTILRQPLNHREATP